MDRGRVGSGRGSGSGGARACGGGGGGGGYRSSGRAPRLVELNRCPDPYTKSYTEEQLKSQERGWRELDSDNWDDVVQKYEGQPATWALRKIDVSVNHFPVESTKGKNVFPFPTLYHYDIGYEILRKKELQLLAVLEGSPPSKRMKDNSKSHEEGGGSILVDALKDVTVQLEGSGIREGSTKGQVPITKRLPRHLTKMILDYLIPKIRKQYRLPAIATDGSYNLYSVLQFHVPGSVPFIPLKHNVTFDELRREGLMEEDDEGAVRVIFEPTIDEKTGEIHTIDTKTVAEAFQDNCGSLKNFNFTAELKQSLESACNTFVKSFPNFRYFSVGRSTMIRSDQDPRNTLPLGGGLVAWRGLSANIAMGWKPYLNVDIANCALMLDRPVLEVLQEVIRSPTNDVSKWNPQEFDEVKSFLNTCKVGYMVGGHKFGGPVKGIGRKNVSDDGFYWEEKKKQVSVLGYYKERYGVILKYPKGPVLLIRKSAQVPAELCTIKKGQSYNRKLDGNQTTNMLKFAKKDPVDLERDIVTQIRNMKLKDNEVLKELGIQIPDKMLSMSARVLVPPTLRYGQNNRGQVAHVDPEGGAWDIFSHDYSFYKTVEVKEWGVLVVGCQNFKGSNDKALWSFIASLKKNGSSKGVAFTSDPWVVVNQECRRNNTPEQNKNILNRVFSKEFLGCQLVVVVIPQKGCSLYGHVKHAAEVDVGLLTQCVVERNVLPFSKDATVQNILLKINSKLGGINHVTVAPFDREKASNFSTLLMDCPILILGADVTHAPPGSKRMMPDGTEFLQPSYAAITGSLGKTGMPFGTEVRAQRKAFAGAAEVIQDLEEIVGKMLCSFKATSGAVPRKIIYFRDGVGDGQFPEVLHIEMGAIRRACTKIRKEYQPKITFITVQKRHKTRIFYHPSNGGKTENAPAGTVIDTEIVHPSQTDFYLLSHKGMLGTSRPSRYHVLWDDSDFSQDVIQSLAYTLCFMYVRCTKSVKMPAPTYYAHLAAERAKKLCEGFETKHGNPNDINNLNRMLARNVDFIREYPMHFV